MRNTIRILTLCLGMTAVASFVWGQPVWPGDINNSGHVSGVDVLYWGVAHGATGTPRPAAGTAWQGVNATRPWTQNFPDGINYVYADCNGDGKVDVADLNDAIEDNFGRQRSGVVRPEIFQTGDPAADPVLQLKTETQVTEGEQTLSVEILLGTPNRLVSDFYGISFVLNYNPALVREIQFLANQYGWVTGNDPNIQSFFHADPEQGKASVALVRTDQNSVSGQGQIALLSIVMEDIIFKNVPDTLKISIDSVKAITVGLRDIPIAPQPLDIVLEDNLTVSTQEETIAPRVRLYPNPAKDECWIELPDPENDIESIELFDGIGRLLFSGHYPNRPKKIRLALDQFSAGWYWVSVQTQKGRYARALYK